MSYIDSIDHEYIGKIGYLPIYHPLEEVKGEKWGAYDFGASPKNLVLGGGSGEHPGLVIHNLPSVVAKYLYFNLTEEEEGLLTQEEEEYITDLYYTDEEEILEFCGWTVRQHSDLFKMASSELMAESVGDDEDVEDWIIRSIGELVFFSLPDLNPEHEKLVKIFSKFTINATMSNVVCIPPGYPTIGGRKIENSQIKWGIHRWPNTP
ncbi:hypothetical protein J8M20_03430 [Pseudoalteromonas luteoviolacea]|uniref:hypothetical protein n=1 Tax=Pseudoalteromonas luteoviolacea TaxID=43657 RepID=UPI001B362EE2|nr:hypothetical protein [Pseudoalteromonas luteoviolacea]MBQ4810367.1 hypothetical protein [Pseudoalteromonas luteoviolacea]